LEAVLDVARDTSASTPARVSALIALVRLAHPAMVVDYRAVTGGLDRAGSALNGCFAGRYAGDHGPSGLSASDAVRIRDLARAIPARYDAAHGCAIGRVLHSVIAALDFRAG
jgi:hypothetical protein